MNRVMNINGKEVRGWRRWLLAVAIRLIVGPISVQVAAQVQEDEIEEEIPPHLVLDKASFEKRVFH